MFGSIHRAMKEKDEGFTLIELLVVIIIIGILAAIAIPVFLNQRKKAVDASMKSDLKALGTAFETFYAENDTYPVTLNDTAAGSGFLLSSGAPPFTEVPGSKGNRVFPDTASGVANTYCLRMENPNGTRDYYYDSDKGGVNSSGCS